MLLNVLDGGSRNGQSLRGGYEVRNQRSLLVVGGLVLTCPASGSGGALGNVLVEVIEKAHGLKLSRQGAVPVRPAQEQGHGPRGLWTNMADLVRVYRDAAERQSFSLDLSSGG